MRYGAPAIGPAIDALVAAGYNRILVSPLYPQYCAATTASVVDAVGAHLATLRRQPALRFLPPYPDDPAYIAALKASVRAGLATLDSAPDAMLASFPGMPEHTRPLGAPHHAQSQAPTPRPADGRGSPPALAIHT